jgi:hypothetical protein
MDNFTDPIGKYSHKMGYVASLDFADVQLMDEIKEASLYWSFWEMLEDITDHLYSISV